MGARHHNTLTRFMKMFYVIDAVNPPVRRGAQSKLIMFKCSREAVRLADSPGGTRHCILFTKPRFGFLVKKKPHQSAGYQNYLINGHRASLTTFGLPNDINLCDICK